MRPNQLIQCLADLKLNFTEEDLAKTTPQKMMEVCDTFMDVAQGYIKDVVMLEDIQELTSTQSPVWQNPSRRKEKEKKKDFPIFRGQRGGLWKGW